MTSDVAAGSAIQEREALIRAFPWERQDGESIQAYRRFMQYRLMPPGERSLRKLEVHYSLAARWAKRWHWTKRVAAYDDFVSESIDGLSNHAQLGARYRAARLGSAFVSRTLRSLDQVKLNTTDDLVNLARTGVQLERQALGIEQSETLGQRQAVAQVAVSFGSAPPWLINQANKNEGEANTLQTKQNEVVPVAEKVLAETPPIVRRKLLPEKRVNCPKANYKR